VQAASAAAAVKDMVALSAAWMEEVEAAASKALAAAALAAAN